jgi:sugar phosphate isomerase/epimerase
MPDTRYLINFESKLKYNYMKTIRRDFIRMMALTGAAIAITPKSLSCASSKTTKFNPLIGVCTGVNNAAMLATAGYDFIEAGVRTFLVPDKEEPVFLENLAIAQKAPIPVKACNSFLPGEMKSVGPETHHAEILKFARTAFRRAQQAGIEIIVFGSGGSRTVPDGFSHEEATAQFVSLLKQMAPIAGEYNVIIVLEPLRSGETNFINTVAEGAVIVEKVDHPNFRLLADIYHMLMENEGPESIINHAHLLKHMHIAEKEGRAAPGTHGEDFTPYFDAMRKAGYKGMISIEGQWGNMETQAPVAIKTMRRQMGIVSE